MNKVSFNKVRLSLAVLLCLCATSMVDAKVKLPALISDGMVLQREQPIKVWGLQLPCTASGLAGLRCLETTDAGKRYELLRFGLFLCQSHV